MSSWLNKNTHKLNSRKIPVPNIPEQVNIRPLPNTNSTNTVNDLSKESINLLNELLETDTFDETILKIITFYADSNNALITFIIPSINRDTLIRTITSLKKQKIDNWRAIIIFDGCKPYSPSLLELLSDKHFLYFTIQKMGVIKNILHGSAGFVRNVGMHIVNTPWIGFIDDDDTIMPNYTEKLIEEILITPRADVISFRMIDNGNIYLPANLNNIIINHIGISFSFKTTLFLNGFSFQQSETEDFTLLNIFKNNNKKIVISPYITYCVRDSIHTGSVLNRIIIN